MKEIAMKLTKRSVRPLSLIDLGSSETRFE